MVFCWYAALQQDLTISEWDLETQRLKTAVGGAADPAGVPPSSVRRHIFTWAKTHTHTHEISVHIRSIMCLETHTKTSMLTWPISRSLWGHQVGTFGHDLAESEGGVAVSIRRSTVRDGGPLKFLPEAPRGEHPSSPFAFLVRVPLLLRVASTALLYIPPKKPVCHCSLYGFFLDEKNHLMNQRQSVSLIRL